MSPPTPPAVLLVLALAAPTLAALPGCDDRRSSRDDDDDDDDGPARVPDQLDHASEMLLLPNDLGSTFGMSECTARLTGTIERDDAATPCDECEAVWGGEVQGTFTTCSGATTATSFRYGLAAEDDGIAVWESFEGEWLFRGDATEDGDGWSLDYTEILGEGELTFGEVQITLTFEERDP